MPSKKVTANRFNKEQLLASKQFTQTEKDLLSVLLQSQTYTLEDAKALLVKEKKRKVK